MNTISKEQIELMIESLEELAEEFSDNSHGSLVTEQWDLLDHLKLVRDNFVLDIVIGCETWLCMDAGKNKERCGKQCVFCS